MNSKSFISVKKKADTCFKTLQLCKAACKQGLSSMLQCYNLSEVKHVACSLC